MLSSFQTKFKEEELDSGVGLIFVGKLTLVNTSDEKKKKKNFQKENNVRLEKKINVIVKSRLFCINIIIFSFIHTHSHAYTCIYMCMYIFYIYLHIYIQKQRESFAGLTSIKEG